MSFLTGRHVIPPPPNPTHSHTKPKPTTQHNTTLHRGRHPGGGRPPRPRGCGAGLRPVRRGGGPAHGDDGGVILSIDFEEGC